MIVTAKAENLIVRSEIDFDQHVACRHCCHQADRIFFQHHVDAVPDTLGMATLNGGADVKREILGFHQSHCEFAGMQADVHLGIDAVQVIEHRHMRVEIVNGNVPVFWHDEIQAYKVRIGRCEFEAEYDLREKGGLRGARH